MVVGEAEVCWGWGGVEEEGVDEQAEFEGEEKEPGAAGAGCVVVARGTVLRGVVCLDWIEAPAFGGG